MKLNEGQIYHVKHSRKGSFFMKVTGQCDTWAEGVVVAGQTNAIMDYNVCEKNDPITVRKSFSTFTEQP